MIHSVTRPIPSRECFTDEEWRIVRKLMTPSRVQQFLNRLPYNEEKSKETLRTFRGVVKNGSAHCLEAALSAAVILEQNSYPAILLDLASQDGLDHVLFLFERNGKWGTVGRSRDPGLHGRKPVFASIEDLVESYADPFVDFSGRLIGFGVFALADLGGYDWRFSERNVWRVQRELNAIPHHRFRMSSKRYRFWHERFLAYKKRFPHRKPLYYAGRKGWFPGYPRD